MQAAGPGDRSHREDGGDIVISANDGSLETINLDAYFQDLRMNEDSLLVASADRVYRLGENGRVLWRSEVGIDGVRIHEVSQGKIHGEGEWDPLTAGSHLFWI